MKQKHALTPIQSPLLSRAGNSQIRHGFFTRQGGISQGIYGGLNVGIGSSDRADHVMENRERVAGWFGLPLANMATVHQIHSPDVVVVDSTYDGDRPRADALVTASPRVILGVLSADCGPILFCDPDNGVVGAAHAGWKGALGGVVENTIEAMASLGAARSSIVACLGPSIAAESYEVGPEFIERFLSVDSSYGAFFSASAKAGHAHFDLQALTVQRLEKAGVQACSLGLDTYSDEERFFSYRRTTHRGEPDYGRQISAIAIMEE
ncbi:MAG TPA: peptidoglycan editing factor PgeF [Pseudorhizobium sp.]|nr:peptidoglycan editing factor PgeF [Pseudorhizobium sp.]